MPLPLPGIQSRSPWTWHQASRHGARPWTSSPYLLPKAHRPPPTAITTPTSPRPRELPPGPKGQVDPTPARTNWPGSRLVCPEPRPMAAERLGPPHTKEGVRYSYSTDTGVGIVQTALPLPQQERTSVPPPWQSQTSLGFRRGAGLSPSSGRKPRPYRTESHAPKVTTTTDQRAFPAACTKAFSVFRADPICSRRGKEVPLPPQPSPPAYEARIPGTRMGLTQASERLLY